MSFLNVLILLTLSKSYVLSKFQGKDLLIVNLDFEKKAVKSMQQKMVLLNSHIIKGLYSNFVFKWSNCLQSRIQNLNAVPEQLRVPKAENDLFQRCISNPLLIFFSRVRLLSCIIPYTLWLATLVAFQSCFLSDNLKTWL